MRKALLILGVLALTAVPLFGQWQGDFRITNTPEASYPSYYGGRCIAADDANVHIAWREVINRKFYVRYLTFPIGSPIETSWGEELSPPVGGDAAVAVHDGTVDVTWFKGLGSPLLFTREKNGSWGPIIEHGIAYSSSYPDIAFDSNGDLHCAFSRIGLSGADAGYSIYYQRKNSGASSYSSPVLAFWGGWSFVSNLSICITSDDAIHISAPHRDGYSVKHIWSTDGGATWNNETIGTDIIWYIHKTSICRDSDDNLFIAYVGLGSYYNETIVATNASGSWVSTQVSQTTYDRTWHPSICCDIYDNVWVAWGDGSRGSAYEIHYNKYDAESGLWEGDSALTSFDDGFPSRYCKIAADEKGNVHICWQDLRDGNFEVYYNWFLGDTTPPPPPGRDLAVVRILQPVDSIGKEPVTPRAVIANLGSDVDSCYAMCVITGPGGNYDKGDIEGIVYLEAGEEDAVEFPSWTPPGEDGDRYRVEVTVYLWPEKTIEDDDPTNNTKVEYATINKPDDPDPGVAEKVDALRIEVTAFRSGSLVSYVMPYPIETTIRVYDVTGKIVRRLQEGELSGSGSVYWDGTDDAGAELAGGLYFVRIVSSGFTKTAKVVLLH